MRADESEIGRYPFEIRSRDGKQAARGGLKMPNPKLNKQSEQESTKSLITHHLPAEKSRAEDWPAEPLLIDTKPIIRAVIQDLEKKTAVPKIAAKFHNTIVELILQVSVQVRDAEEISRVALGGGVFQNFF
ncbi:hypothetical protein GTO10_01165, partial [Candidatus Saccharibacteria bacterium]|nr:hypothetical protein [Candidatus Saccharibacteria bacterium]